MNSNQLPLSGGIAVFFAVIIGYFVIDPAALDGFRPDGDSRNIKQVHGLEDVQARLWQDPFAAAAQHLGSLKKKPGQIQLSGKAVVQPLGKEESPSFELTLHPSKLIDEQQTEEVERHSLEKLLDEIKEEAKEETSGKITVLATMVSAGPYAKPAETRLRTRYAILSALGTEGYYPKDAEHIGFVNNLNKPGKRCDAEGKPEEICKRALNLKTGEDQLPFVMPYEWYESKAKGKEKHVLLLWLDESAFAHKPLAKLNLLFNSLGDEVSNIKLIGPYGSGTLKSMVKEAGKKEQDFSALKKVEVYSATATAVTSELIGDAEETLPDLLGPEKTHEGSGGIFSSFQRTIDDDGKLAKIIVKELKMRMKPKEALRMNFHVAIVSEWDTAYGRALPKAFADAFTTAVCQEIMRNRGECDEQELELYEDHSERHLHRFRYMRGIDGTMAARGDSNQSKTKSADASDDKDKRTIVERPEGRSQKDYLRRLAGQISALDKKLKFVGEKGIRAIGVLGSDVYDKLLILRVLRERFPKAVFFTTDLDAVLLHPAQFRWTRNMVVASAFDLRLPDEQQENVPPFRDSYQTSIYRSTKMAIENSNEIVSLQSAYEIGRNGPTPLYYQDSKLTHEEAMWWDNGWDNFGEVVEANEINLKPIAKYFTVLMLVAFLAILFWWTRIKKGKKRKNGWVFTAFRWLRLLVKGYIFLIVLQLIYFVTVTTDGIFGAIFDPQELNFTTTVFAISFSIALYIYFYLLVWCIQRPWRELSVKLLKRKNRRYRNSTVRFKSVKKALSSVVLIIRSFIALFCRPFVYAKSVHFAFWFLVAFCYDLYDGRYEPIYLTEGISIWPTEFLRLVAVWLSFFLLCRGWSHMKKNRPKIGQDLGLWIFHGCHMPISSTDIRYIWTWYKLEGTCWKRIKRIFWPAMIWLTICVTVFGIQSPNIPFRGEEAYWTDLAVSALAIFSVIMLFVFVVDSTLHCRDFIQKLVCHDTWWPFMEKPKSGVSGPEHKMICKIKREWQETRIIAMLSDDISRMVYYPIYVILLLLAAQSDYFDNWDMPYTLVLVATVNVGISLYFAIMLRRSAVRARAVSLEKIHHVESEVLAIQDDDQRERIMRKLIFYKELIQNIRQGAFLPISEQPWLRALTLMFGGGSSLLLLQFMAG